MVSSLFASTNAYRPLCIQYICIYVFLYIPFEQACTLFCALTRLGLPSAGTVGPRHRRMSRPLHFSGFLAQGLHVAVWCILGPQSSYVGIPLGPKYILYFYMETLGRVEGLGLKGLPGPSKAVPSVILYLFFISTSKGC